MSVQNALSLHTRGGFDLQDVIGAPAYGLAAVVIASIGSFSLFGFQFSEVLWSSGGIQVTSAMLVATLVLGLSWTTNRAGDTWDDLDEMESVAVGGGLAIILAMALIPAARNFVYGSDLIGAAAFVVLSTAYTVVSWY